MVGGRGRVSSRSVTVSVPSDASLTAPVPVRVPVRTAGIWIKGLLVRGVGNTRLPVTETVSPSRTTLQVR